MEIESLFPADISGNRPSGEALWKQLPKSARCAQGSIPQYAAGLGCTVLQQPTASNQRHHTNLFYVSKHLLCHMPGIDLAQDAVDNVYT